MPASAPTLPDMLHGAAASPKQSSLLNKPLFTCIGYPLHTSKVKH
jgi:hypothetical protein